MSYVDGFVVGMPEKNIDRYVGMAELAGSVWMKHGALHYYEAIADDVPDGEVTDFRKAVKAEPGETVVFAFVLYKSREHRDEVVAKVMADPEMTYDSEDRPFDGKRMIYGGFRALLDLKPTP